MPGSVSSQDLKIGMTCANFRNLGKTPTVNDLLIIIDSTGVKGDLIDFLIFVDYVEILEFLFFKDLMILLIFSELKCEE